jgi:voltage-gated potassium channel
MSTPAPVVRHHGNSYEIFILVLTVLSLAVMACELLPLSDATETALTVWDNLICILFLGDFLFNLTGSHPRGEYFWHERGWLDLLGSIPSLGILRITALLRLARLSRLARIVRLLGGQGQKQLVSDVVHNRGQYALFITMLLAIVVMSVSSVLILQFESASPDANIKSGGDALWWSVVTITTVGYGDRYPITTLGRLTAVFVMFAGIGIIGALASILAALLVSPAPGDEEATDAEAESEAGVQPASVAPPEPVARPVANASDLDQTREELARSRQTMDRALAEIADLKRRLEGTGTPDGPSPGTASS